MKRKTIFEHLRQRLEIQAGIWPEPVRATPLTLADLEKEWSTRFETLMRNRILMGTLRYGQMSKTIGRSTYDYVSDGIRRFKAYRETGNLEHLVDIANICMVEFVTGSHPKKHFNAGDDGEHAEKL